MCDMCKSINVKNLVIIVALILLAVTPSSAWAKKHKKFSNSDKIIKRLCQRYGNSGSQMRNNCIKKQYEALAILKKGSTRNIPDNVFKILRRDCSRKFVYFSKRVRCEKSLVKDWIQYSTY